LIIIHIMLPSPLPTAKLVRPQDHVKSPSLDNFQLDQFHPQTATDYQATGENMEYELQPNHSPLQYAESEPNTAQGQQSILQSPSMSSTTHQKHSSSRILPAEQTTISASPIPPDNTTTTKSGFNIAQSQKSFNDYTQQLSRVEQKTFQNMMHLKSLLGQVEKHYMYIRTLKENSSLLYQNSVNAKTERVLNQ